MFGLYGCKTLASHPDVRTQIKGAEINTSGPSQEYVTGEWTKLYNEQHQNLYSCRVIKLRIRWVGHAVCMWEMGNAYMILAGKHKGKETTRET